VVRSAFDCAMSPSGPRPRVAHESGSAKIAGLRGNTKLCLSLEQCSASASRLRSRIFQITGHARELSRNAERRDARSAGSPARSGKALPSPPRLPASACLRPASHAGNVHALPRRG